MKCCEEFKILILVKYAFHFVMVSITSCSPCRLYLCVFLAWFWVLKFWKQEMVAFGKKLKERQIEEWQGWVWYINICFALFQLSCLVECASNQSFEQREVSWVKNTAKVDWLKWNIIFFYCPCILEGKEKRC